MHDNYHIYPCIMSHFSHDEMFYLHGTFAFIQYNLHNNIKNTKSNNLKFKEAWKINRDKM